MKRYRSVSTGRYISESKKRRIDCFIENNVRKIVNDHSYSFRPASQCEYVSEPVSLLENDDGNTSMSQNNSTENSNNLCSDELEGEEVDYDYETETNSNWRQGRRIVELGFLVDKLCEGCAVCHSSIPLNITNIVHEIRYGLGSLLTIRCQLCDGMTVVPTAKRHRSPKESPWGRKTWDVNTKLALGMLHSGIGERKVANLLSTLNIPPCSKTTLKKREREIGQAVEEIAHSSCSDAAVRERELTEESPVSASFDGGWQKRGSGKSYSSLSGHASFIGKKTGKCIAFSTRNKYCRKCDLATKKGCSAEDHGCRKNWEGSSKAIEADMCISMLKNLERNDVSVGTIIMDNDSTTISRARAEVKPDL
ncbi:uncharacterized protein LOC134282046 [Saccostrea cucullata]|uniref:uncharacterized protein LOC134282046 n=1 Tax=Saccostrea cuccullata TaxID=36930 RepID=UPI002ED61E8E